VFIFHARYSTTNCFRGFIRAKGVAVFGVDLDSDAVGIIVGKYYAGWMWQ
jgi:hypothetical protein